MKRSIRVLLIDDDEDYHILTRELLAEISQAEFELDWAASYEAGLEAIQRNGHEVCLVDYRLGARNGLELMREALALGCKAPLILMTGQGDLEVDVEAMNSGAADYLIKGEIDAALLERSIRYAVERAQSLESLRASEQRFRNAFDGASVGMALVSMDGCFLQVNRSLCEMLDFTEPELLGVTLSSVTHADDTEASQRELLQLSAGELSCSQSERRYLHKRGGVVWTLASMSLLRDAQGKPLYSILQIQDITQRKLAEDALRKSEEQLRQAQKMEAIGRLAGGVAHDFNNILTVITGYAALLLQRLPGSDPLRKDAEEIQKSSERAAGLTRQLLAFSRRQLLNPKVLDLNAAVAGTEKMLRRLIGEDIELHVVLDSDIGKVKADATQIEQVIMNLVVNARDAMPMGGKLTIQTAHVSLDQARVFHNGELVAGEYVMLAITDTGVGMPDQVKLHLFEPFFTTKGLGKGTGLGLATCYGIIKQSAGCIRVYSEPGHGSVFKIYLPVVEGRAEPSEQEDPDGLRQGTGTVLVVEDEDALRELAACVLRGAGYTVLEARNGEEGLQVAEEQANRKIDLVVTDVIMPKMGGKEMVERLQSIRPESKILFTSGYTDDALARHGVLDPGVAFLEKPFSPTRLTYKVRELLATANN